MKNTEKDINKAYDDLMESTTLTDEQIEEIVDVINSTPISQDTALYNEAITSDHGDIIEEPHTSAPLVDVGTGMVKPIEATSNIDKEITIDDIMDLDKISVDFADTKISNEDVLGTVQSITPGLDLSEEDIAKVAELAKRKLNGEDLSWYMLAPDSIKRLVNDILHGYAMVENARGGFNKQSNAMRSKIVASLLDSVAANGVIHTAQTDLNTAMSSTLEKLGDDSKQMLSKFFDMQMEQYTVNYPKQADEYEAAIERGDIKEEDIDTINRQISIYRGVANSFVQSYTYEDMLKAYHDGKLKVKQIQIQKFERTLSEFDFKYSKVNVGIDTLAAIVPIIGRMVADAASETAVKKFVCIFVNYTRNMKPDNIVDHIFMYYFIKHIISTVHFDHSNETEVKFYGELTERIVDTIKMLDAE